MKRGVTDNGPVEVQSPDTHEEFDRFEEMMAEEDEKNPAAMQTDLNDKEKQKNSWTFRRNRV